MRCLEEFIVGEGEWMNDCVALWGREKLLLCRVRVGTLIAFPPLLVLEFADHEHKHKHTCDYFLQVLKMHAHVTHTAVPQPTQARRGETWKMGGGN